MSVAESKSSSESKLLASNIPDWDFWTFAFAGVDEQPVVKPKPATADAITDNLKKRVTGGFHAVVVGLYIQIPNNE